jgi:hypothetical protein
MAPGRAPGDLARRSARKPRDRAAAEAPRTPWGFLSSVLLPAEHEGHAEGDELNDVGAVVALTGRWVHDQQPVIADGNSGVDRFPAAAMEDA